MILHYVSFVCLIGITIDAASLGKLDNVPILESRQSHDADQLIVENQDSISTKPVEISKNSPDTTEKKQTPDISNSQHLFPSFRYEYQYGMLPEGEEPQSDPAEPSDSTSQQKSLNIIYNPGGITNQFIAPVFYGPPTAMPPVDPNNPEVLPTTPGGEPGQFNPFFIQTAFKFDVPETVLNATKNKGSVDKVGMSDYDQMFAESRISNSTLFALPYIGNPYQSMPPYLGQPPYLNAPLYPGVPPHLNAPPYPDSPLYPGLPPPINMPSYPGLPPHFNPPAYPGFPPQLNPPAYPGLPPHLNPPSYPGLPPHLNPPSYPGSPPQVGPPPTPPSGGPSPIGVQPQPIILKQGNDFFIVSCEDILQALEVAQRHSTDDTESFTLENPDFIDNGNGQQIYKPHQEEVFVVSCRKVPYRPELLPSVNENREAVVVNNADLI